MSEDDVVQVQTTLDDRDAADAMARSLVDERLSACVQVLGPITSRYRWHGRVDVATEWLLLVKTTAARYPGAERRIRELHPYDEPEIVALPVTAGSAGYLRWVAESVAER